MLGRLRKKAIRAGSESLVNRGWEQLEEGVIEGVMASPPGASDSGVGKEENRSSLGSAEEHTHSPVAALSRKGVSGNEEGEEKEEHSDDAEEEEEYEQVAVKASESSHHQDNHHDQQHNAFHAPEVDLNFSFPESEWDTLLLGVDESVTVTDVDEVL
jgi:hypothetical protein